VAFAPPKSRRPDPSTANQAFAQGLNAAAAERQRLGLGTGPIEDAWRIVEAQGVEVGLIGLPPGVSGIMLSQEGSDPFILVNADEPPIRWTFSVAHEYAHVLLDRDDVPGMVTRADDDAAFREIRANAFASTFLAPAAGIEERLAEMGRLGSADARVVIGPEDVVELASHFAVSREVILHQLRRSRLVDEGRVDELLRDSATSWRKKTAGYETVEPRRRLRSRFVDVAEEAYRKSEMSERRLAEYLECVMDATEAREAAALIARSEEERAAEDGSPEETEA
jgi:Zn-dependent peptidase ImmA (M78 family)